MAKVTLFSARACPYAHRTRLVLAEKNVSFELREIDLQNKPAWFDKTVSYPWFERWPALSKLRGLTLPTEHVRIARWLSALAELPSVRSHENPADYYVERYARFVAPNGKAAAVA